MGETTGVRPSLRPAAPPRVLGAKAYWTALEKHNSEPAHTLWSTQGRRRREPGSRQQPRWYVGPRHEERRWQQLFRRSCGCGWAGWMRQRGSTGCHGAEREVPRAGDIGQLPDVAAIV